METCEVLVRVRRLLWRKNEEPHSSEVCLPSQCQPEDPLLIGRPGFVCASGSAL